MNFQQLSNLQYWTSLFSSPWSIVTNLIDILIVIYILYHFTNQSDHHLRGDCSGGYLFTRDSNRFGAIGPGY